jgi:aminoglycoside phosphotransferase (APT) family kinase protein
VPAARAAGVRTPALIAVDHTRELLPAPYTIYERVHGVPFDRIEQVPEAIPDVWRQLGQDLARLHTGITADGPVTQIAVDTFDLDPRHWLLDVAAAGVIPTHAAAYLEAWLECLAPLALMPLPLCFCHGDMNVGNVLVEPDTPAYLALVDWGGCLWGDAAWDLALVSLRAVPWLLEGYRSVAPMPSDATVEARILWRHVRHALAAIHHESQRTEVWVTQRLDRLFTGMRYYLATPCAQWLADVGLIDLG